MTRTLVRLVGAVLPVCAIRSDDREVLCWGDDEYRQVSSTPVGVPFDSVSVAFGTTCAIRSDDKTQTCWGGIVWNPR